MFAFAVHTTITREVQRTPFLASFLTAPAGEGSRAHDKFDLAGEYKHLHEEYTTKTRASPTYRTKEALGGIHVLHVHTDEHDAQLAPSKRFIYREFVSEFVYGSNWHRGIFNCMVSTPQLSPSRLIADILCMCCLQHQ